MALGTAARRKRRLRKRDGDNCHWCGVPMLFADDPRWTQTHPLAVTVEHLVRRCEGGSNDDLNLRLAHDCCNQHRNRQDNKDHHMNSQMTDNEIRAAVANFRTAVNLQADTLKHAAAGDPCAASAGASYACMNIAVALMERVLSGGLSARTRHLLVEAVNDVHTRLTLGHFKELIYGADPQLPSGGMPEEGRSGDNILPYPRPAGPGPAAPDHRLQPGVAAGRTP